MAQYNGSEFNSEKGTQGNLLKFLWSKIYDKFTDVAAAITTALADYYTKAEIDTKVTTLETAISTEATTRANAVNDLEALILSYKNITPWNPANAFPTQTDLGAAFKEGNFVQVTADGTVGGVTYKAGDILICTTDGATTVADFADVQGNVEIATSSIYGTVKLLADLAAYQAAGNDSSVISKATLQAILGDLSSTLTTAFESADTALQTAITTAYNQAVTDALGDYYTKTEVDTALGLKSDSLDVKAAFNTLVEKFNLNLDYYMKNLREFRVDMSGWTKTSTLKFTSDRSWMVMPNFFEVFFVFDKNMGIYLKHAYFSNGTSSQHADWNSLPSTINGADKNLFDVVVAVDVTNSPSTFVLLVNPNIRPSGYELADIAIGYHQSAAENLDTWGNNLQLNAINNAINAI